MHAVVKLCFAGEGLRKTYSLKATKCSPISYIHNFIFIFPGYITNQFNDQLPVGLIAQLVRALHRYRRGQGSSPGKPDFFRLSFRNCISSINNCEDLLYLFLHSAVQMYEFHIFIISVTTVEPTKRTVV